MAMGIPCRNATTRPIRSLPIALRRRRRRIATPSSYSKEDGARFNDFLHGDWTSAIAWRGLNPVALARYTFTPYQRSDMLADFFAEKLFGQATYADVLKRYNSDGAQPFVMLNATDLGHEIGFPFTQGRFDLLCSDLARFVTGQNLVVDGGMTLHGSGVDGLLDRFRSMRRPG